MKQSRTVRLTVYASPCPHRAAVHTDIWCVQEVAKETDSLTSSVSAQQQQLSGLQEESQQHVQHLAELEVCLFLLSCTAAHFQFEPGLALRADATSALMARPASGFLQLR